jgi:hypothetical protein
VLNVTMQGQPIGLDQFKDFVSVHDDHHATKRTAKPTPMTAAVTQSIIKFSVSGFIGFFRLS